MLELVRGSRLASAPIQNAHTRLKAFLDSIQSELIQTLSRSTLASVCQSIGYDALVDMSSRQYSTNEDDWNGNGGLFNETDAYSSGVESMRQHLLQQFRRDFIGESTPDSIGDKDYFALLYSKFKGIDKISSRRTAVVQELFSRLN